MPAGQVARSLSGESLGLPCGVYPKLSSPNLPLRFSVAPCDDQRHVVVLSCASNKRISRSHNAADESPRLERPSRPYCLPYPSVIFA